MSRPSTTWRTAVFFNSSTGPRSAQPDSSRALTALLSGRYGCIGSAGSGVRPRAPPRGARSAGRRGTDGPRPPRRVVGRDAHLAAPRQRVGHIGDLGPARRHHLGAGDVLCVHEPGHIEVSAGERRRDGRHVGTDRAGARGVRRSRAGGRSGRRPAGPRRYAPRCTDPPPSPTSPAPAWPHSSCRRRVRGQATLLGSTPGQRPGAPGGRKGPAGVESPSGLTLSCTSSCWPLSCTRGILELGGEPGSADDEVPRRPFDRRLRQAGDLDPGDAVEEWMGPHALGPRLDVRPGLVDRGHLAGIVAEPEEPGVHQATLDALDVERVESLRPERLTRRGLDQDPPSRARVEGALPFTPSGHDPRDVQPRLPLPGRDLHRR